MAEVPYNPVPQVSPDSRAPDVYQKINASPESFGAAIGRGLQAFGEGVTKIEERHEKVYDEAVVDDASNQYQESVNRVLYGDPGKTRDDGTPDLGYLGTKGRGALDAREGAMKQLDDEAVRIRAGLKTVQQQQNFDNFVRRYKTHGTTNINSHANTQAGSYYVATNDASEKLSIQHIANNADNAEEVANGTSDLINSRVKNIQLRGGDDTQINEAIQSAKRDALSVQLQTIAVKDPLRAIRMLDNNRETIGTLYDDLSTKFRARANHQIGVDGANRAIIQAGSRPSPIIPAGGTGQIDMPRIINIAETVNDGETRNGRTINAASIGQIAADTNGSKSYGFQGLNTRSGSTAAFVREYGAKFGLTAPPGSPEFDQQWRSAAANQTEDFKNAQLAYFRDHNVIPVVGDLQSRQIPVEVANDPRVLTYFSDRRVQMGTIGLDNVTQAWNTSGGDVPQFLRNMNQIDAGNLQSNFRSAIASGVYGPEGHQTRLEKRLDGALRGDAFAVKADAYRIVMGDASIPEEAKQIAVQHINQRFTQAQIAAEADTKARRELNDQAANGYVTRMLKGDYVGIIDQIANDPNLTWEAKRALGEAAERQSGSDLRAAEMTYGPGFWKAYKSIVDPDDPVKITSATELYQRAGAGGDLTLAGVQKLQGVMEGMKKSIDGTAAERTKIGLLNYAKKTLSFEMEIGNFRLPDPKGEKLFNSIFIPKFEKAYDDWVKAGKDPWLFLTKENVDKMMEGLRSKSEMDQDRLIATGEVTAAQQGGATQPPPKQDVPPAPAGANEDGWKAVISKPPVSASGKPWPYTNWAAAIETLRKDPSPERIKQFNKAFEASGYTAEDVLGKLKIEEKKPSNVIPIDEEARKRAQDAQRVKAKELLQGLSNP